MSYKVQLINRDLGASCLFGRVQGLSGKTYATSRFQPCGYHVAEMTAEEYEKAADDISRGWRRPLCRWVPRFMEVVDEPQTRLPETRLPERQRGEGCNQSGDGGIPGDAEEKQAAAGPEPVTNFPLYMKARAGRRAAGNPALGET